MHHNGVEYYMNEKFNSQTGKIAGSRPRKPKDKKPYIYQNIADAAGVSIRGLKYSIKNKEFDPRDLKSIAYYIVKKTLQIPPLLL